MIKMREKNDACQIKTAVKCKKAFSQPLKVIEGIKKIETVKVLNKCNNVLSRCIA